jgi:diguanylate cyclase (GGDEF)-like protein
MHDQAMVWNTDSKLQVTSLTARLRGFAGVGLGNDGLHVSDLWGQSDPFAVAVVAHHWALDGESLVFEAPVRGNTFRFEIQPLHDVRGYIVGVSGRAVEAIESGALDSQTLRHIEHAAELGTWYEDLRTGHVTVSEGLARMLELHRHPAQLDIRAFDHPDDRARVGLEIDESGEGGYTCDHRILCASGRMRNVRERVRTIRDDRGVGIARVGTMIDITDLKEREAELSELALQDALTRLPNRAALTERLESTLERCRRDARRCALLFIDLDNFKAVNDAHGHEFGDRVLTCVADRLSRHVRATDTVARLGGDEFVVLIEDLFSDDAGLDAARKILRSFDEPFTIENRTASVSASIGIANYPSCGTKPDALLASADREMYLVKRNGGSGVKLAPGEECAQGTTEKVSCQVHSLPAQHPFATRESA